MGVQQPMVSKKEQTLAVRHGCTATHGACNRNTPLAVRRWWTATHGFDEGKTLRRTSWVYSNPWFLCRSNCLAVYRGGTATISFCHGIVSRGTPECGVGARAKVREGERERMCVWRESVWRTWPEYLWKISLFSTLLPRRGGRINFSHSSDRSRSLRWTTVLPTW